MSLEQSSNFGRLNFNADVVNVLVAENLDRKNLTNVAMLYADVFATPPWNEFVKCRDCEKFEGKEKEVGDLCECGGSFLEAYPLEETIEYILHEANNPSFRLASVNIDDSLVGFSWSYLINTDKFIKEKWDTIDDQKGVKEILDKEFKSEHTFRYFSECGINSNSRGLGLANILTEAATGPEDTVYRTNCFSPMMAIAQKFGYKQIMGPKVIIDRSQKTIINTGEFISRLDIKNPHRTLFVKKADNLHHHS